MPITAPSSLNEIKKTLQAGHFSQALTMLEQLSTADNAAKTANITKTANTSQSNQTIEEQAELLYLTAVTQRYCYQVDEALITLQKLIQLIPDNARAFQEQGYCLLTKNDVNNALTAFHKAVELNPALISAWQKIVELFNAENHPNYSSALEQLQVLQSLPPAVLSAMDLMHEGKLHKAEQVCRKFLQQHSHQADAMCLLAEIGAQLKIFDDAEFLLESCINLYPENKQAQASYIHLLNRLGKFEKATSYAEQYLAAESSSNGVTLAVQATLANCYISLGKLDSGINIYNELIQQSPERAGIYVQLGHAYKTKGNAEKAVAAYKKAYQITPDFGDAFWSLANIKTYKFEEQELTQMKNMLADASANVNEQVYVNFALGKAYEDQKLYDESFTFYKQGNALKKQALGYDADKTTELINQQITYCTKDLFEQKAKAGCCDAAPIFILGLPRAGSTLLEQILASHSQVDGTMELHNILGIALNLRGRIVSGEPKYPKNLFDLTDAQLTQLGEKFIHETQSYRQDAPFFIDKMPNNFIHIGLIKLILPNAKIIDARRDPMACCFSGFKQLFGEGQEFSYNLSDMAQYYRDYERLMAHWDDVLPGQVLRVQHEKLVNNVEEEVQRILDYCGLGFEQSCLEFYNTKRNVHTPSAQQVRQPISAAGLEQWKNYAPYLAELEQRLFG